MSANTVKADLVDRYGTVQGELAIVDLPRRTTFVSRENSQPSLRESTTYRYTISGLVGTLALEPSELFDCDDETGHCGRLRTGLSVGRLVIEVRTEVATLSGTVDVAPAKLEQVREYQQMLDDIATHAAEAVLQGFAPSSLDVTSGQVPADLLYQQFAVLAARLQSEEFAAAMGHVLHRPHQTWAPEVELRPVGTGYPSGSAFARAVAAPGPRIRWRESGSHAVTSLPSRLTATRLEPTTDTTPNRFVRFALEGWRALAARVHEVMDTSGGPHEAGPVRRGRDAADEVLKLLDELLGHALFREVGHLNHLPTGNQVLLKRDGYRQIFQTFALVETGIALSFESSPLDDSLSASQRNVATLYEFWCYLALAEIVGDLCGERKTARAFAPGANGMSLTLRAGNKSALSWEINRHGRRLAIELYFNRQFSVLSGNDARDGSWSRAMRPDCSLHIRPLSALPRQTQHGDLDVWIHFDAKYRVERLTQQLIPLAASEESQQAVDAEETESIAQSKREDLLKMHAYRDAIRRTAGAYVLYPGHVPVRSAEFGELLPGLGAFPLRPGPDGGPSGSGDLKLFLDEVLTHVSRQASNHERDRFWTALINERAATGQIENPPAAFLDRPPADTDVLLGYVRSPEQWEWIHRTQSYNIRADDRRGSVKLYGRELSAPLLLLYMSKPERGLRLLRLVRRGPWRAADRRDLEDTGYPQPGGQLYFVTSFEFEIDVPAWLRGVDLEGLRPAGAPRGGPITKTWWELLASASRD